MGDKTRINYKILGKNIKDARDRLGRTQNDVAQELEVIISTYGKFERGVLKPNLDRLVAICSVLHVDFQDVLRGALVENYESSNAPPTNAGYVRIFQNLVDQCRKPETIKAMLAVCSELLMIENNR